MRTDHPTLEEATALRQAGIQTTDDLDQATAYLGVIDGPPSGDCLLNFLVAASWLPVVIVTRADNPCPRWMWALADRVVVMPADMPDACAARLGASVAAWLGRQPHAKRKLN